MEWMAVAAVAVVAAFLGMAFGWFIARTRAPPTRKAKSARPNQSRIVSAFAASLSIRSGSSCRRNATICTNACASRRPALRRPAPRAEETQKRFEEERGLLAQAEHKLADTFKSLASDTLRQSTGDFLKLAEEKLQGRAGCRLEGFRGAREKDRRPREARARIAREARRGNPQDGKRSARHRGAAQRTTSQPRCADRQTLRCAADARRCAADGARSSSSAWSRSRGWSSIATSSSRRCRPLRVAASVPIVIIQLPGNKNVVVDSKVPLKAYLEATECADETSRAREAD